MQLERRTQAINQLEKATKSQTFIIGNETLEKRSLTKLLTNFIQNIQRLPDLSSQVSMR